MSLHKKALSPHILLVEIDNPPANSLSKAMKHEFNILLEELEAATSLRVVIFTGRGTKFCTGDDLKEAASNIKKQGNVLHNLRAFSNIIDRIEALSMPVIAAINGWCVGGGLELALCCDIRIAVDSAKFITAGVNVGLTASAYRLPRLIGVGRAKRMLLTGGTIDAQEAKVFGLITDIHTSENLLPEAIRLAELIASKAPLAIQATKRIANTALDLSPSEGYVVQQQELEQLSKTKDHREALKAFGEKRKPDFEGV
ncbi:MAG: enoyl-CoA hydratase/isomerase family protein [Chitinophagales bacterium]